MVTRRVSFPGLGETHLQSLKPLFLLSPELPKFPDVLFELPLPAGESLLERQISLLSDWGQGGTQWKMVRVLTPG